MGLIGYLLLAVAALAMVSGLAYKTYEAGADSVRLEWSEANKKAREAEAKKSNEAAKGLEADREKTKIVYRTITKQVDRIVDRPVYRNVCLDSAGLCLANAAILGTGTDSCKLDGTMPAPGKPVGRDGGRTLALDYRLGASLPGLRGEAPQID